jgi:uncharacterized protein YjbJ (UPF0337 family)
MNNDTIEGQTRNITGRVKETTGVLTGDDSLWSEGVADQVGGNTQKAVGSLRDALSPILGEARDAARKSPLAAAALVGVIGIALFNTLRGTRR